MGTILWLVACAACFVGGVVWSDYTYKNHPDKLASILDRVRNASEEGRKVVDEAINKIRS